MAIRRPTGGQSLAVSLLIVGTPTTASSGDGTGPAPATSLS